jgi:hypothetical protein
MVVTSCHICNKAVKIESATSDEQGKAVHGGCYFLKITARKTNPIDPTRP